MSDQYILALDQGTTSSRAILFGHGGEPVCSASNEFRQIYPRPGWVEHDPLEIWDSQRFAALRAIQESGIDPGKIAAIGITNQRETTVLWEKATGNPVHNAIVWQCRRTAPLCTALQQDGFDREIQRKTGLVCDAYFSGTKIRWLLDNVPDLRKRAQRGEILFGTVDSWLLYKLTGGRVHATDLSNASRTMLFNIHDLGWDPEILQRLQVPEGVLPSVFPSNHVFGMTFTEFLPRVEIPVSGMVGDQQAALFGQACFHPGMAKVTYGTGAFLLMNTGPEAIASRNGLLTTIGWGLGQGITYCLEGSVFIAGAAIQWLRDEMGLLSSAGESESAALSVPDNGGVYFVPALVGLGAPHWDMRARGMIIGLTRGSSKGHIVRAALEAMAFQTRDVIQCMAADSRLPLRELRADGGAAQNNLLLQFQSDILDTPVLRPRTVETTALGAAYLAGLGVGYWKDREEIQTNWSLDKRFQPSMKPEQRERLCAGWDRAVERSKNWVLEEERREP